MRFQLRGVARSDNAEVDYGLTSLRKGASAQASRPDSLLSKLGSPSRSESGAANTARHPACGLTRMVDSHTFL
jgi:hypothetical protein